MNPSNDWLPGRSESNAAFHIVIMHSHTWQSCLRNWVMSVEEFEATKIQKLHGINSLTAYWQSCWLPTCWENVHVVLTSRVQLYQVTQVTPSVWPTHQNWSKSRIIKFQAILCKLIAFLEWAISVVIKHVCFYLFQARTVKRKKGKRKREGQNFCLANQQHAYV